MVPLFSRTALTLVTIAVKTVTWRSSSIGIEIALIAKTSTARIAPTMVPVVRNGRLVLEKKTSMMNSCSGRGGLSEKNSAKIKVATRIQASRNSIRTRPI